MGFGVGLYLVENRSGNIKEVKAEDVVKPEDFTERGDGAGPDPENGDYDSQLPRWYRPGQKNKGEFIQKDRSPRPHGGGDQHKLFNNRGKRQGTLGANGVIR